MEHYKEHLQTYANERLHFLAVSEVINESEYLDNDNLCWGSLQEVIRKLAPFSFVDCTKASDTNALIIVLGNSPIPILNFLQPTRVFTRRSDDSAMDKNVPKSREFNSSVEI